MKLKYLIVALTLLIVGLLACKKNDDPEPILVIKTDTTTKPVARPAVEMSRNNFDTIGLVEGNEPVHVYGNITNISENKDAQFIWKVVEKTIPENWYFQICDPSQCVAPNTDSAYFRISKSNAIFYFAFGVDTKSTDMQYGTVKVKIKIYPVGKESEAVYVNASIVSKK